MKSLVALLVLVCTLASAQSAKKIKLDFDDNLVPPGWTLTRVAGTNSGVADGRFYAGQVDSRAVLSTPYAIQPKTKNVTFEWHGSVFVTYWGNQSAAQFIFPDGQALMARLRTSEFHYGPVVQVELAARDDYKVVDLSIPHGTYRLKAEFTDSSVTLTGRLNGALIFTETLAVTSGARLADVDQAQLFVYETVGDDVWMDNVKITQFKCEQPVSGQCPK